MPVLAPLPAWPAPTISTISQWDEEEETDGEWYQQINRARLATADTGSVQVSMDFSDQTQKTELVSPYCAATEPLDEANVDTWQHDISGIPGQLYPDEATEMEAPFPPVPKQNQVAAEARGESLVKKNPIPAPGPMLAFP